MEAPPTKIPQNFCGLAKNLSAPALVVVTTVKVKVSGVLAPAFVTKWLTGSLVLMEQVDFGAFVVHEKYT